MVAPKRGEMKRSMEALIHHFKLYTEGYHVPPGEVYAEYENPRGHLGFYIESQGGVIPYRVKIRGPSFVNLAITSELCRNVLLADVPAIVGSIDIVMGEVDR